MPHCATSDKRMGAGTGGSGEERGGGGVENDSDSSLIILGSHTVDIFAQSIIPADQNCI